jgi:hypothetical protein
MTIEQQQREEEEKNPGLFLQAAYELLKMMYPFARFTVVGSGVLLQSLS